LEAWATLMQSLTTLGCHSNTVQAYVQLVVAYALLDAAPRCSCAKSLNDIPWALESQYLGRTQALFVSVSLLGAAVGP
jgi:hypothetical protein